MKETLRFVKESPSALAGASLDDPLRPRGGEDQEEGGSTAGVPEEDSPISYVFL